RRERSQLAGNLAEGFAQENKVKKHRVQGLLCLRQNLGFEPSAVMERILGIGFRVSKPVQIGSRHNGSTRRRNSSASRPLSPETRTIPTGRPMRSPRSTSARSEERRVGKK